MNRKNHNEFANKIIKLAGGQRRLGKICGVTQQAVGRWAKGGIPAKYSVFIVRHFYPKVKFKDFGLTL